MSTSNSPDDFAGAMTLLRDCVRGKPGDRLLIVCEKSPGFYDSKAPGLVKQAGEVLGMRVFEAQSSSFINNDDEKAAFVNSLTGFDHIVFFSRVGDQIRFAENTNLPSTTMCYTLNSESLNSNFGTACYHGMHEIKEAIDEAISRASEITVTCPRGTNYTGKPRWSSERQTEVSIKRFPLLVPRPIPANGFNGRVVLSRFLLGTGSRYYEPYYLSLPNDVTACIEHNRITHFEGNESDVARVQDHYVIVSKQFCIDPWHVDSWHAGIHPGCRFEADAEADIFRWSGTAFGNPRILHFHTCGNYAPGEICWNILDPTIYLDGIPVWEAGRLYPDRLPHADTLLASHPNLALMFSNPSRNIGLTA